MTVAELKTMSVDERLVLMEELWDSLCHENVSAQSPEWHKEILDDRIDLINAGKAEYISIQELKKNRT